jgi:hypothetical protein
MPVVTTGPMGDLGEDGRQTAEFMDEGPVLIATGATLKPWVRYTWVAECQGDFAPGSVASGRPVQGLWSTPSDPVSVMLVPPTAPQTPQALSATGIPAGGGQYTSVSLTFTHLESLSGGIAGSYRVRILRRMPAAPMEELDVVNVGGFPYKVSGMRPEDVSDMVPTGTLYSVSVIDPLGREGEAAVTVLL